MEMRSISCRGPIVFTYVLSPEGRCEAYPVGVQLFLLTTHSTHYTYTLHTTHLRYTVHAKSVHTTHYTVHTTQHTQNIKKTPVTQNTLTTQ